MFSALGMGYQSLSAQAGAFHDELVRAWAGVAGSYASAEAAAATPLQDLLNLINVPFLTLTGRPLIGNGASRAPGSGANGGAGGGVCGADRAGAVGRGAAPRARRAAGAPAAGLGAGRRGARR